jgi:hypothetical protein
MDEELAILIPFEIFIKATQEVRGELFPFLELYECGMLSDYL